MFTKNKTHLTLHLFTLGRVFFPENRFKSSERRKRERKEYTNGWKRPDPRVPPILTLHRFRNTWSIYKLEYPPLSNPYKPRPFNFFSPSLVFHYLSNKDREGNRAKIIESLPSSNSLLNSWTVYFFHDDFDPRRCRKLNSLKSGGWGGEGRSRETPGPGQSSFQIVTAHSRA